VYAGLFSQFLDIGLERYLARHHFYQLQHLSRIANIEGGYGCHVNFNDRSDDLVDTLVKGFRFYDAVRVISESQIVCKMLMGPETFRQY
jgi:hypothetical protein